MTTISRMQRTPAMTRQSATEKQAHARTSTSTKTRNWEEEDEEDSGVESVSESESNDKIYFVLLRAHGGIPYDSSKASVIDSSKANASDQLQKTKIVTVPDDMKFYKITSARNGTKNCGRYDYDTKKLDIQRTIINDTLKNKNKSRKVDAKLKEITKEIQDLLRTKESETHANGNKLFNNANERSIISKNTFINKTFQKYPSKYAVQVFHIDEEHITDNKITSEDIKNKDELLNCFFNCDEYDNLIKKTKLLPLKHNGEVIPQFDLEGLIHHLHDADHIRARNVVLMDFSCSALPKINNIPVEDDDLIKYLNKHNYHGGKLKSHINKKKTKKYKNTNNRKTKNRKTKN